MTRAQAFGLSGRLEAGQIPHRIRFALDAGGAALWSLELDPDRAYSDAELRRLFQAAQQEGLTLSARFAELGLA